MWPDWATVAHSSDIRPDGSCHPIEVMHVTKLLVVNHYICKVILVIILRKIEWYVRPVLLSTEKMLHTVYTTIISIHCALTMQ